MLANTNIKISEHILMMWRKWVRWRLFRYKIFSLRASKQTRYYPTRRVLALAQKVCCLCNMPLLHNLCRTEQGSLRHTWYANSLYSDCATPLMCDNSKAYVISSVYKSCAIYTAQNNDTSSPPCIQFSTGSMGNCRLQYHYYTAHGDWRKTRS